jgi:UDP-N-acetylglucosamine 4-epimerase
MIRERVVEIYPEAKGMIPVYRDFRAGDVRHSLADISKAETLLGYTPRFSVRDGLDQAAQWYIEHLK